MTRRPHLAILAIALVGAGAACSAQPDDTVYLAPPTTAYVAPTTTTTLSRQAQVDAAYARQTAACQATWITTPGPNGDYRQYTAPGGLAGCQQASADYKATYRSVTTPGERMKDACLRNNTGTLSAAQACNAALADYMDANGLGS